MKIDCAIVACDDNPLYLDFWPLVSKVWKEKFDITPILLYKGDGNPSTEFGEVVKLDVDDRHEQYLYGQCSRYWYAGMLGDKVAIISDIDMFPLSKYYFIESIKDVDRNKYVHLNDVSNTSYNQIPACYHVATGDNFNKVLNTKDKTLDEYIDVMKSEMVGTDLRHQHFEYWFLDERFSTKKINELLPQEDRHFLVADPNRRIDRVQWGYNDELLKNHQYNDCHSLRPYGTYKKEIDRMLEIFHSGA